MEKWYQQGGVLIIGYTMFRSLYEAIPELNGNKMAEVKKATIRAFQKCLLNPGADLVVCDEGHLLKNHKSRLNIAVNKIRTLRRIVLTGTPLQNNLSEYFCMVEFVKPRFLGSETEFKNLFIRPIENGQYIDSTDNDILMMKYQSHILHKLLDGCVQRRDFLPPKQEFVLFIRLKEKQISLYEFYIKNIVTCSPIADFAQLRKLCNHPKVLVNSDDRHKKETKVKSEEKSNKSNSQYTNGWWKPMCSDEKLNSMESSNKMLIFFSILAECEAHNEKLLVFSSCLSTLNIIEYFLAKIGKQTKNSSSTSGFKGCWTFGTDYFRLDGSKNADERKKDIMAFNQERNLQARLFLLSAKTGSLGINLMAANRVVIFDASWNPSHDVHSVFRSYRIGQKKECFVYRLITLGSMEEKIYDRQVSKLGIAKRVVDQEQIGRFYKADDLQQLYSVENINPSAESDVVAETVKDNLLNHLRKKHGDVIFKHHDHDILLKMKTEETLSQQEKDDAWKDFENENEGHVI